MKFLGLVPSAYAPGERRRQGSIPQAGHTHARRALGEGAWASRFPATVRQPRQRRLEKPPQALQDLRGKAQGRRGTRARTRIARGKHAPPVVVAIARALVGLLWAMAKQGPVTPSLHRPMADNHTPHGAGVHRASARAAAPVLGSPFDGVQRPSGHPRAESAARYPTAAGRGDFTHG